MSAPVTDAREAGRRVEEVLDRLAAAGDREACTAAEELVRVLMDFYGAGLARIVELVGAPGPAPAGPAAEAGSPLARLLDDELVAGLLALHDLHPEDVGTRIARALDSVREPVELLGFDRSTGTLRLRSTAAAGPGGGCGCGSGGGAAPRAVEDALARLAPEVTGIELEAAAPQPALLQIGTRPQTPARVP
ncbi:hypothetical protein AB0953_14310 [Streptomyces sp. NPDC046866]|uniref:hypothetical protein n=1 Tax=Streptomyces sp. NPDC046866 TaxID=3154921 RepID=UPI0034554ADA